MTLGWLPFSSPIVMPLRMSAVDVPPWEIGLSLFALAAGCYIAVYHRGADLSHGAAHVRQAADAPRNGEVGQTSEVRRLSGLTLRADEPASR